MKKFRGYVCIRIISRTRACIRSRVSVLTAVAYTRERTYTRNQYRIKVHQRAIIFTNTHQLQTE